MCARVRLQAARERLEAKLAKEADGVDILAEVTALAMAHFREEYLYYICIMYACI